MSYIKREDAERAVIEYLNERDAMEGNECRQVLNPCLSKLLLKNTNRLKDITKDTDIMGELLDPFYQYVARPADAPEWIELKELVYLLIKKIDKDE